MTFDITKESSNGILILPSRRHISNQKNYIRPERGFNKNKNELKLKLKLFWITRNFLQFK